MSAIEQTDWNIARHVFGCNFSAELELKLKLGRATFVLRSAIKTCLLELYLSISAYGVEELLQRLPRNTPYVSVLITRKGGMYRCLR